MSHAENGHSDCIAQLMAWLIMHGLCIGYIRVVMFMLVEDPVLKRSKCSVNVNIFLQNMQTI